MTKSNDAVKYQKLLHTVQAVADEREFRIIKGRVAQLVADGHSHTGALKRALMERKVTV